MELLPPLTRPLAAWRDRLLGRGDAACTVPILDGVLQPNQRLETATVAWSAPTGSLDLRDLSSDGRSLWLADGARVLRLTPRADGGISTDEQLQAKGPITALCALPVRLGGGLAYAVEGREVLILGGQHHGRRWTELGRRPFIGVNGLAAGGDALIVTEGSAQHAPDDWQHDLMTRGASGRICRLGLSDPSDGKDRVLADGLQHPFGAVAHGSALWVSESWRHRVVALGAGDQPSAVLDQLPGYPSRLAPAAGGGFWLSVFAGRTQLVEFVLREPQFRQRMIDSMPPELWIAPQLRPSRSFLEPLQGGAIKQMGVLKPWAPPRSYGLVIRLDAAGRPLASLHSRVDGQHHGVVAVAECAGSLYLLSRGAGRVLRIALDTLGPQSMETGA